MANMHLRKTIGKSTRCRLVIQVARRLKPNASKRKNRELQKAQEIRLREQSAIVAKGTTSKSERTITKYA
jgi:hypothetical protein